MIKKNTTTLLLFFIILTFSFVFYYSIPNTASAQLNLNYPELGGIRPGGDVSFQEFIIWLYYIIIIVASIAAFGIIIWGGIVYLTSAGNPQKMREGMSRIWDAVIGLLIVLLSYLILQTISPQLTEIPDLDPSSFIDFLNYV